MSFLTGYLSLFSLYRFHDIKLVLRNYGSISKTVWLLSVDIFLPERTAKLIQKSNIVQIFYEILL
jgi:hypothetical protein